ncbi:MAG: four helix bundle protein [Gemmatimonadaceae bacterium]|nr:four helix bundle protein [Gemmatimonadaceae bacterium]NUQ93473.1 four helix bundle protein [Gemmatimonadaceae bacterium]NUR19247.1 four helix bundle protein [Gemmatimonadaceae bacterium]NUS98063.1 four helix bundle protein [Gemmatimonadaceae bacterium]
MDLDEWMATVPRALRADPMWKIRAYQLASYCVHLAGGDALRASRDPRLTENVPQLMRAIGGVTAHIAEGYSRISRRDRIRYYEYALGSVNETKSWYMGAAITLDPATLDHRMELLCRVSQLLLAMIRNERKGGTWGPGRHGGE